MNHTHCFENLYIDRAVLNYELTEIIKSNLNFKNLIEVDSERHPGNGLLLTENKGNFIKPCPGQKGSICCGYTVIEWGLGCTFGCEYCIIQNYTGAENLTLFLNLDKCLNEIDNLAKKSKGIIRLGTGQFSDPMAVERFFPVNRTIIEHISQHDNVRVEIKTKSCDIEPLLKLNNLEKLIMAFSLNPQTLIERFEKNTASLNERLNAAVNLAKASNCNLAFHFDPILPINNWKDDYSEVFELMKQRLKNLKIAWISLGTFRFPAGFIEKVESNYPGTELFTEEFYPSADGKIRYFRPFREEIYKFTFEKLNSLFPNTAIYICMETEYVWQRLIGSKFKSSNLTQMLDRAGL